LAIHNPPISQRRSFDRRIFYLSGVRLCKKAGAANTPDSPFSK
jgi:hypothetical protein